MPSQSSYRRGGGGGDRGGRGGLSRGGGRGGRGGDRGGRGGNRGGDRGGRGGNRGGRGGKGGAPKGGKKGGKGGGKKVIIQKHRHEGVFIVRGTKDDTLVTLNLTPGHTVYGEKKIVEEIDQPDGTKIKKEYRTWNPFRSKLGAAIFKGASTIYMKPGSKVLYLGAASGTTVSHVSDIVGEDGVVYAVELSNRSGRDLLEVAKVRPNIVPIIEDAKHPLRYRMMITTMVDVLFADVAQPDQARIFAINAQYYLKNGGAFIISVKANCIDSVAAPSAVFAQVREELTSYGFKPIEQATLEPYQRDHAAIFGIYRPGKDEKKKEDKMKMITE